jgi:hypothetical protein
MANTQAMCTSFKRELMTGTHNFGVAPVRATTAADTFKAALYLASATVNAATTVYSSTGEVTGTGYTAGGITVTNANVPASAGTTGYWTPSASFSWTSVTLATSFDAVLVYNSTQGNKAVSVHTFTPQTVLAGNFSLTMPTNDSASALLRVG